MLPVGAAVLARSPAWLEIKLERSSAFKLGTTQGLGGSRSLENVERSIEHKQAVTR